jgi:hypothetical protein
MKPALSLSLRAGQRLPLAALWLAALTSAAVAQDCGSSHTWQAQAGAYRVGFSVKSAASAAPAAKAAVPAVATAAGPAPVAASARTAAPAALVVGQHFQLDLQLCAAQDAAPVRALRVDADMPAHRHGMNYRSSVKAVAADQWQAEGLMFHMPGRWRFIIELDTSRGTQRLTREVEVL